MDKNILKTLTEKINNISAIDIHTHLNSSHLSARGLHDILLYHMVISDLYSAGCPSGSRLSEDPDEKEKEHRIKEAIPYIEHIQNTSNYWLMRNILKDLYKWTEKITMDNWRKLDEIIQGKALESDWPKEVFRHANVIKACSEYALRGDRSNDDILCYSLEWAFFTRTQWGMLDAPLYELEYAWQFDEPVSPLPVTTGKRMPVKRKIKTVADIKEAMKHYCRAIPFEEVVSTAQHLSTDINYQLITDGQMQSALDNRPNADQEVMDIYASYLLESFLDELEKVKPGFIYQFSLGAEPLPFETDSRLNQVTVKHISKIISRHPKIQFQCFLASKHINQSLCTLCRELPNLSLAGYWWHNFFPCSIGQIIDERLDMVASNKLVGFFSDAYCAEWLYVKSKLVRAELSKILTRRVEREQYTIDEAIEIAYRLLRKTPEKLFGRLV